MKTVPVVSFNCHYRDLELKSSHALVHVTTFLYPQILPFNAFQQCRSLHDFVTICGSENGQIAVFITRE